MAQNRFYSSTAAPTALASSLGAAGNPSVNSVAGLPGSYPFTVLIDWGLATQEAISVTSAPTGTGPFALPCTRGIDGTVAQAHAQGAVVVHGVTAEDYNEPQVHIAGSISGVGINQIHGLANGSAVVGTTDTQTLSNKTLASVTVTGTATMPATVNPTDAAQKTYVDTATANQSNKNAVAVGTAVALPSNTYANGASGVGATLTATATGVLTVDGVATVLGQRILVKNEVAQANNGIYSVTTAGAVGVAYVLTRTTDMNTAAQFPGASVAVELGTVNAGHDFVINAAGPFVVGTTAVVWQQQTGGGLLTAGNGIVITGNQINNANPWYSTGNVALEPTGTLARTLERRAATATSAAMTSGTVYMAAIFLPAGITATNLTLWTGGTAKLGGTHGWYVLCNSARSVVAVTADKTDAATTWGTTNAANTIAFNTPYAVTTSGLYYVGIMVAATTMPTFAVATDAGLSANLVGAAPILYGVTATTAQTTPPALSTVIGAITGTLAFNYYAYIT